MTDNPSLLSKTWPILFARAKVGFRISFTFPSAYISSLKGRKLFNLSDMIRYFDSSRRKSNKVHPKLCYRHIFPARKFFLPAKLPVICFTLLSPQASGVTNGGTGGNVTFFAPLSRENPACVIPPTLVNKMTVRRNFLDMENFFFFFYENTFCIFVYRRSEDLSFLSIRNNIK